MELFLAVGGLVTSTEDLWYLCHCVLCPLEIWVVIAIGVCLLGVCCVGMSQPFQSGTHWAFQVCSESELHDIKKKSYLIAILGKASSTVHEAKIQRKIPIVVQLNEMNSFVGNTG